MSHQHVFRRRYDRPPSLDQFQTMLPDDYTCAAYLAEENTTPGTLIVTDGNTAYRNMAGRGHHEIPIPKNISAHVLLKQSLDAVLYVAKKSGIM